MRYLCAALLLSCPIFGQSSLPNGNFETGTPGRVPPNWFVAGNSPGFTAQITNSGCTEGKQCAVLQGPANPADGTFGTLVTTLPAGSLLNKKITFRAAVRVTGAATQAQMWMQVINTSGGSGFFYNMSDRPIVSDQWNYYSFEGTVLGNGQTVNLGFILIGSGTAWVDDATLTITGQMLTETPEPPRPLTDAGLENLVAFAKLAGYVRYFHPSDQAAAWDWNSFTIDGVRQVESAASPQQLAQRLQTMLDPIAPTVRVFPTGAAPDVPSDLRYATTDTGVERWFHHGLGIGVDGVASYAYNSIRTIAGISSSALPAGYTDPVNSFEAVLGAGVTARVPTVLYTDGNGTVPARPAPSVGTTIIRSIADRGTRLADVILAWNVQQQFFPYFDVEEVDMPGVLRTALSSAARNTGAQDFAATMRRFMAALHDGHGNVYYDGVVQYNVPLIWAWAEGQVIVARVKDAQGQGVQAGDRVLAIDGSDIADAMELQAAMEPGATPQWIRWRTLQDLTVCNATTQKMQLDIEPYTAPGTRRSVQFNCRLWDTDWSETRPSTVADLEPGIVYVDINRATDNDFAAAAPRLQAATGIVYDFRGYPQVRFDKIFPNLITSTIQGEQFFTPAPVLPDQAQMSFEPSGGWTATPQLPYFPAKRVFLTDGRAISQAESDLDLVEHNALGELVGEPTAGTTGDINPFTLPGGFHVVWTDMKVLKPDGSRFHGVGIRPTIPASRTRSGIAAGVDEILQRGLQIVKGPQAGTPPAITAAGIVNGANFTGGAVAPGEIVGIFGTGLGPVQGVQGVYDEMGYLSRYLGEARVFFDGIQAPLTYVSSTQVNAIVPYGVQTNTVVRVEYQLRSSNSPTLPVAPSAPGIFALSGQTQGVIVNQNGTLNSASAPASRGETVTFFATGEGQTAPGGVDGKLPAAGKWPAPAGDLAVLFGAVPGHVQFKGEVFAGVLQMNVRVPANAPAGNSVALVLSVNGNASGGNVTIALK